MWSAFGPSALGRFICMLCFLRLLRWISMVSPDRPLGSLFLKSLGGSLHDRWCDVGTARRQAFDHDRETLIRVRHAHLPRLKVDSERILQACEFESKIKLSGFCFRDLRLDRVELKRRSIEGDTQEDHQKEHRHHHDDEESERKESWTSARFGPRTTECPTR